MNVQALASTLRANEDGRSVSRPHERLVLGVRTGLMHIPLIDL